MNRIGISAAHHPVDNAVPALRHASTGKRCAHIQAKHQENSNYYPNKVLFPDHRDVNPACLGYHNWRIVHLHRAALVQKGGGNFPDTLPVTTLLLNGWLIASLILHALTTL